MHVLVATDVLLLVLVNEGLHELFFKISIGFFFFVSNYVFLGKFARSVSMALSLSLSIAGVSSLLFSISRVERDDP